MSPRAAWSTGKLCIIRTAISCSENFQPARRRRRRGSERCGRRAVLNTVFNPLSVLGGVLTTAEMLSSPAAEAFVREGMNEVCAVAAAAGYPVPPDLPQRHIDGTRAMPPYKTSMALDYENRRPLEVEAILGNVVR